MCDPDLRHTLSMLCFSSNGTLIQSSSLPGSALQSLTAQLRVWTYIHISAVLLAREGVRKRDKERKREREREGEG